MKRSDIIDVTFASKVLEKITPSPPINSIDLQEKTVEQNTHEKVKERKEVIGSAQSVDSPLNLPIAEIFYKSSELDEQPFPSINVIPRFPPHAVANGISGWVRLSLMIDKTGRVKSMGIVASEPPSIFDEEALASFRITPFVPGKKDGQYVNSEILIKINFDQSTK